VDGVLKAAEVLKATEVLKKATEEVLKVAIE